MFGSGQKRTGRHHGRSDPFETSRKADFQITEVEGQTNEVGASGTFITPLQREPAGRTAGNNKTSDSERNTSYLLEQTIHTR